MLSCAHYWWISWWSPDTLLVCVRNYDCRTSEWAYHDCSNYVASLTSLSDDISNGPSQCISRHRAAVSGCSECPMQQQLTLLATDKHTQPVPCNQAGQAESPGLLLRNEAKPRCLAKQHDEWSGFACIHIDNIHPNTAKEWCTFLRVSLPSWGHRQTTKDATQYVAP